MKVRSVSFLKSSRSRSRSRLLLMLILVPLLSGCRLIVGGLALLGIGTILVGVGAYEGVKLTGRAAKNAATFTGEAISSAGEEVAFRAGEAKDASSRATYKVGTSMFSGGEHTFAIPQDVYAVWNASYRALAAMNFKNISSEYDALSGWLTAETIEGKEVRVELKREPTAQTNVSIRVGVRGDEDASRVIEEWIVYYLGYAEEVPL